MFSPPQTSGTSGQRWSRDHSGLDKPSGCSRLPCLLASSGTNLVNQCPTKLTAENTLPIDVPLQNSGRSKCFSLLLKRNVQVVLSTEPTLLAQLELLARTEISTSSVASQISTPRRVGVRTEDPNATAGRQHGHVFASRQLQRPRRASVET